MSSHFRGPTPADWSVFAEKVVEERDAARARVVELEVEVARLGRVLAHAEQWRAGLEAKIERVTAERDALREEVPR